MKKNIKWDGKKRIYQSPRYYFNYGNSPKTIESWTGGHSYKHIFAFELFGFKLEFWKKL